MLRPKEKAKPYNYFDTPDGHDIEKKLWFVLKPTLLVAAGVSTADVLLYSKPKTYSQTLGRYANFIVPFVGMSTAFVITTNLAANWRKKDDKLNWFLGGCAAGGIMGVWRKSIMGAFVSCVVFGGTAILKKHAVDNGWVLNPTPRIQVGGVRSTRQDWTLTAERPRNWTTGKE